MRAWLIAAGLAVLGTNLLGGCSASRAAEDAGPALDEGVRADVAGPSDWLPAADGPRPDGGLDGGPLDGSPDAPSADGAGVDGGTLGALPTAPAPPVFQSWTCRRGWLPETKLAGTAQEHTICVPPSLPASCAPGTLPVLGQADCQPIGAPCPAGDWPEDLPAGATVAYVKPGASGDGRSPLTPSGDLLDVVFNSPPGTIVALAKGTYTVDTELDLGINGGGTGAVALWGACASATMLDGTFSDAAAIIGISSAQANTATTIRNLTLTGDRRGIHLYPSPPGWAGLLTVDGVALTSLRTEGISALDGARASLRAVAVVGTRTRASVDGFGTGIFVGPHAQVSIEQSLFDGNHGTAILAVGEPSAPAATVTLTDVTLRNTQPTSGSSGEPIGGTGMTIWGGSVVQGAGVLIDGNANSGVSMIGVDGNGADSLAALSLDDLIVRGNGDVGLDPSGAGLFVAGLDAGFQSSVTLRRAVFDGNAFRGLFAYRGTSDAGVPSVGATLSVEDLVVSGTLANATLQRASGLIADTVPVMVSRALFEGNVYSAVASVRHLSAADTVGVHLSDVVIRDTQAVQSPDGHLQAALAVQSSSGDTVERAIIKNHQLQAIEVFDALRDGPTSTLELTDVVIDNSEVAGAGPTLGLNAIGQVKATATRLVVRGCRGGGINGFSLPDDRGTPLIGITDALVEGTADANDGEFGDGVFIEQGAVSLNRARIRSSSRSGVLAFGATVVLQETVLDCNPIQLDQEAYNGVGGAFQSLGGNVCGCANEIAGCQAVSASLQPPNVHPASPTTPTPP
jgi:hypothetical protein